MTDDASEEEPVSPSSPAFFLMNCAAGVSLISVTSTSTQTSGSVRGARDRAAGSALPARSDAVRRNRRWNRFLLASSATTTSISKSPRRLTLSRAGAEEPAGAVLASSMARSLALMFPGTRTRRRRCGTSSCRRRLRCPRHRSACRGGRRDERFVRRCVGSVGFVRVSHGDQVVRNGLGLRLRARRPASASLSSSKPSMSSSSWLL